MEFGSHDELIEKEHGLYERLFASSKQKATLDSVGLRGSKKDKHEQEEEEDEEEIDWEAQIAEEEENAFDVKRARNMATVDSWYLMIGAIGAVMAGGVFPMWGLLFAETIDLLFRRVEACPSEDGAIPDGFASCEDYWKFTADDIKDGSFLVAGYWVIVMVGCLCGNIFSFWGFGTASERLNKRLRDGSFAALLRQEVGYFEKRSVGSLTSQLQEDAARIHAFSGEPVRAFLTALASVVTGITLSFVVSFFATKQVLFSCGWIASYTFCSVVHVAVCPSRDWMRSHHGIRDVD
jgi:ATP-binding cassette subfamily B (MDR/TAP) protein 1